MVWKPIAKWISEREVDHLAFRIALSTTQEDEDIWRVWSVNGSQHASEDQHFEILQHGF